MSWESTAVHYRRLLPPSIAAVNYRQLNQGVARRLGGLHSAAFLLHSVDFAVIAALQTAGLQRVALLGTRGCSSDTALPCRCQMPKTER